MIHKNNFKRFFTTILLSICGAFTLFIINKIVNNQLSYYWIIFPILINIFSIYLIVLGVQFSSVAIFNTEWSLISTILVTFMSLYMNEKHSIYENIGLILAFISIIIINFENIKF